MTKKDDMKQWITLIVVAVLAYWIINNFTLIGNFFSKIINVLSPFLLGIVIAFILNIPMTKIEKSLNKMLKKKKAPVRIISIIVSLVIFILIIAFVLFLLIPEVIASIENLIATAPDLINNLENWVIDLLDKYPDLQTEVQKMFATNSTDNIIPEILNHIVNGVITFISDLVSGVINLFTAVVFSIYILSQKEYLIGGTKKIIKAYLKPKVATRLIEIGKLTNQTFTKFISGQCVEAVILGSIFFVVLSLFRFPYALIISVLTTITALIPIFGAMIAMCIGAILIAIESPLQALIFIVVFQVIQQIEGNFIYPRVVGKSVGLSPMWTLFAISVGGSLCGILGMLTALPLASIAYALLKDSVAKRLKSPKPTTPKIIT
ncbi:MAG: AI-2E family transporter [Bacilli bacterium]|nr:AI-2E family transporter [Bacilli bacterium]